MRPSTVAIRLAMPLAGLCLPGAAVAETYAIAPLLRHESVDAKQVMSIHQLTTSELEFQPGVTSVIDLGAAPPAALDASCLQDTACLKTVTAEVGGDRLVAGILGASGPNYHLDLLLYDKEDNEVVRRKVFAMPQDPTAMADAITAVVKELLTGGGADGAVVAPAFSVTPREEDLDFVAATPPASPMAPVPAPSAPVMPSDAEAAAISFGGSVDDITAEQIDSLIKFGAPSPAVAAAPAPAPVAVPMPVPATTPPPPAPAPPQPQPIAAAPAPVPQPAAAPVAVVDLDGRQSRTGGLVDRPGARYGQLVLRGGYSKYYAYDFITGGGEIAAPVYEGLHLLFGVEVYAVQRQMTEEEFEATGIISQWAYIYPITLGGYYKFTGRVIQPYVGGDGIMAQYYRDEIGSDWAGGARLRGGVDLMFVNNFGLNANVALGAWTGQNLPLVDPAVKATGLLPQLSAGTVLAF